MMDARYMHRTKITKIPSRMRTEIMLQTEQRAGAQALSRGAAFRVSELCTGQEQRCAAPRHPPASPGPAPPPIALNQLFQQQLPGDTDGSLHAVCPEIQLA